MITVKARIRVSSDGTLSGRAIGLPAGEHEAELTLIGHAERPISFDANTLLARVRAIQQEVARLPVLDNRSPDEIIGYNEQGHFD
jgi:hypothetical protein